jgi:hypothetical protein
LSNTIITRCFTVYQLADIAINELPKVIQQYDAKMVVVSDLLDMFIRDPQIETNEATYLINEIINSITKSKALEDVLSVVSIPYEYGAYHHHNNKPALHYNETMIPRFDKYIELLNSREDRNKMIDIKMRNNFTRNKNAAYDFHNHKVSCSIKERDLLIIH